jgi:hypothetical protein
VHELGIVVSDGLAADIAAAQARVAGQTEFLVISVNGEPRSFDSLYDTFTVPAAEDGKPGEIKDW